MGWSHGIAIANIRKENGLSQRQLADLSGVKNSTISRIEANKVNPDLETIEKLANALELEYLDFFATIYEKQISKELISINEKIQQFSPEKQEAICKEIEEYLKNILTRE